MRLPIESAHKTAGYLTLVPTYGRDYKSKREVMEAWDAGKDFMVQDMMSPYDGKSINKADAKAAGIRNVNIRYKGMRSVAVIKVAKTAFGEKMQSATEREYNAALRNAPRARKEHIDGGPRSMTVEHKDRGTLVASKTIIYSRGKVSQEMYMVNVDYLPGGSMARQAKFPKGKDMTIDEMVAYFEEAGNAEAAAEWRAMHEKYQDEFTDGSEKKARFSEGPEGEREFQDWFEDQPEDFQQEWEANTEEYGDKFKTAARSGTHYIAPNGDIFVDTAFLNSIRGIPGTVLEHMGFGEFYADTPKGRVDFDRMRGKDFPGQSGRSHRVYGEGVSAHWLVDQMTRKGLSKESGSDGRMASRDPGSILDRMVSKLSMADRIELKAWAKRAGASSEDMVAWIKDRHPAFQPFRTAIHTAHQNLPLPVERVAGEKTADLDEVTFRDTALGLIRGAKESVSSNAMTIGDKYVTFHGDEWVVVQDGYDGASTEARFTKGSVEANAKAFAAWFKAGMPTSGPKAPARIKAATALPVERVASEQEADKLDAEAEAAEDQAEADRAKADAARMKGASSLGIEAVDPDKFYVTTENGDTYGPYRRERDAWRDADGYYESTEIETTVDSGHKVLKDVVVPRLFALRTPAQLRRDAGVSRFASLSDGGSLIWMEG